MSARCRFAPSPTGYLHVGSAQSALFNWLFARHSAATFLLRIEDTDAERNRPELTDNILDMLRWLGIDWDGEAVHQTDRFDLYREATAKLEATPGLVYWCDCTLEDREARRKARGGRPGYDGFCRDRGLGPAPGRALRLRTPDTGVTAFDDVVRGRVEFSNENIEDFVIVRSNGLPLFLFANVVDDHAMGITHVIRGEDHLNNTPKQLLLWEALGFGERPRFAHLPLLVNAARKKLSKRRDDVSVADYKARGILPQAMRNYLALLGWAPRDGVEIRPIEEMVEQFRLEDVNPSPAFFDQIKLEHVNAHYIRELDTDEFIRLAAEFMPTGDAPRRALEQLAPLVQERVRTLDQVPGMIEFLWLEDPPLDENAWGKVAGDPRTGAMLDGTIERLEQADWTPEGIEQAVRDAGADAGFVNDEGHVKLAKAQASIRIALTGRPVGPPLWESTAALGRDRAVARLRAARSRVAAGEPAVGS
jgi:glutamyl-tRNA synthetase